MKKTLILMLLVGVLMVIVAGNAHAYIENEDSQYGGYGTADRTDLPAYDNFSSYCTACHGAADPSETPTEGAGPYRSNTSQPWRQYVTGPHGRYTNNTDKCGSCHEIHEAASTNLLPAATTFGVCNTCHDMSWTGSGGNAGGGGVYGAIRAQGGVVDARHNIEGYNNTDTAPSDGSKSYVATSVIPGGNTNLAANLTCSDCHTPHGNTQLAWFTGERTRTRSGPHGQVLSNKLLKDDLRGTSHGTYTVYGSEWCAACHDRRHDLNPSINNHPVDMANGYGSKALSRNGVTWTAFATGDATLPDSQAGWSREATGGWQPNCQQCHEDSRDVESAWSITSADGTNPADNPRWQNFPHETVGANMTVETADDLCLNCHPTTGLP